MRLQGEFAMYGGGSVSDKTRRAFEADGLTPPRQGHIGFAAGPVEELVAGWFYLEQVSPGVAGALAASGVQAVTHIVKRMTKWFKSGESPAPDVPNRIVVGLGGVKDADRVDIEIVLGSQYKANEIEAIIRATLDNR